MKVRTACKLADASISLMSLPEGPKTSKQNVEIFHYCELRILFSER